MKRLRWAMDGGFWDVDMSTPVTVEGVARAVPFEYEFDGSISLLPLGLSRGPRLNRPKQIDFFQRFMSTPFLPCFTNSTGLSLHRLFSLPLPYFAQDAWFSTLLAQFNVQKFVTSLTKNGSHFKQPSSVMSFLQHTWRHLSDQTLYALHFCSELLLTPDDTLLLSLESHGAHHNTPPRKKAILHHKFPHHNLTVEAASPALFVDQEGNYWDVPFTTLLDLASVASDSGTSCHFCINHIAGLPKQYGGHLKTAIPSSLLPGLCAKCAVSFKNSFDFWRSEASKTNLMRSYDMFLSNPHISASMVLGAVFAAAFGDNSLSFQSEDKSFLFRAKGANSAILADLFASVSVSAQHGNFQKLFLDLTRFHARLDIPSGLKFLSGATQMAYDLCHSRVPRMEEVQAICPSASLSFQQQIAGPFSFRVDAEVTLDLKKDWYFNVSHPVFAVEYALQVLGSAKAIAWYSQKQREFMIELRFFET